MSKRKPKTKTYVRARKQYKCDITGAPIYPGETYRRINSKELGVFHFHVLCTDSDVRDYFLDNFPRKDNYEDYE
ncbi:MAG: hypothetical protein WC973_03210 [Candidatus Dojkabacteria bacterium]